MSQFDHPNVTKARAARGRRSRIKRMTVKLALITVGLTASSDKRDAEQLAGAGLFG